MLGIIVRVVLTIFRLPPPHKVLCGVVKFLRRGIRHDLALYIKAGEEKDMDLG